jgi:hypothetical protein
MQLHSNDIFTRTICQPHAGFGEEQWAFYAAFKDVSTLARWFLNEAHLNLEIHQRSTRTLDGDSPFHYFDGPTMVTYRQPSKAADVNFCRRHPTPAECDNRWAYPFLVNYSTEHISVNKGHRRGDRLFADERIAAIADPNLEISVSPVDVPPRTRSLLLKEEEFPVFCDTILPVKDYMSG